MASAIGSVWRFKFGSIFSCDPATTGEWSTLPELLISVFISCSKSIPLDLRLSGGHFNFVDRERIECDRDESTTKLDAVLLNNATPMINANVVERFALRFKLTRLPNLTLKM